MCTDWNFKAVHVEVTVIVAQQDLVTHNLISVTRPDLSDNHFLHHLSQSILNVKRFVLRVSKEKLQINLLDSTMEWRKPHQGQNWLVLFDFSSVDEKRDCTGLTKHNSILTFKQHILNNRLQRTRTSALDIYWSCKKIITTLKPTEYPDIIFIMYNQDNVSFFKKMRKHDGN